MSSTAATAVLPNERLEVLFDELAELAGQRNAIDGRIVEIVAEMDRDKLCGATGARSIAALVAWKLGSLIGQRQGDHHRGAPARGVPPLRQESCGRVGCRWIRSVSSPHAPATDRMSITRSWLRSPRSTSCAPRSSSSRAPTPTPGPNRSRSITKTGDEQFTCWRITLPHDEAATFDAALTSHREALIAEWKQAATTTITDRSSAPPMPNTVDAFLRLVEAGWDAEAARRPHGQHTTVVVHVDVEARAAALHLGPLLSDAERQYLTCDATCEVWFERDGRPIGVGRATRTVSRRLRRALEHRDRSCAVPGCGATRGLHAHHIRHWEDGGPTELANLVLLCPFHHRAHHRGDITITGPADNLTVTDSDGQPLSARHHWRGHPPVRHPMSRPIPGRPANAPTGGGTTPSNHNHHPQDN